MSAVVLIVDDNPTNLKLASDVLEADGFVIQKAENAEEAQIVLANLNPDIILMDIALPGMDGLTLTRQLKSNAKYRHVPVIALTAFAMKGDDRKAFDAGCSGYITKPINTRDLARQLRDYLEQARDRPAAMAQSPGGVAK